MSRWVRIGVVCLSLGALLVGVAALRDMRALVGQPWPGFAMLPNGEVGPPVFVSSALRDHPGVPRFQDRIVSVNGEPVGGVGTVLRRLAAVAPDGQATYEIEARDGTRATRTLPVPRFTARDLQEFYLPLFAGATVGLLLGMVPVLARPAEFATRAFFLFNLGLTLNFGYLSLDYFTIHRFVPWGVIGGWLTTSTLMHYALLEPEPLPIARRHPRLLPWIVYLANALVWLAWVFSLHRSPAALRLADVGEITLFVVGTGMLLWNLVRTARHATDTAARRLARVLGVSITIAAVLGGTLLVGSLSVDVRLPAVVHLLPFWGLGVVVTWAMAVHNLFELDSLHRPPSRSSMRTPGARSRGSSGGSVPRTSTCARRSRPGWTAAAR